MKSIYFLILPLLICGCSDSTNPTLPAASSNIGTILAEGYWEETSYLVLESDGKNFLYDRMPMAGLYIGGAWGKSAFSRNLGQFYVDGSGSVTKYFRSESTPVLKYENSYRFSFVENGLRAEASRTDFENGWFAGQTLEVVSAADDRIVLIFSLADRTVDELHLGGELSGTPVGIQTTWNRIENPPETLMNAIPAEEWDPSGSEEGTE